MNHARLTPPLALLVFFLVSCGATPTKKSTASGQQACRILTVR